jgi:hypothetical protein
VAVKSDLSGSRQALTMGEKHRVQREAPSIYLTVVCQRELSRQGASSESENRCVFYRI